ncbi:MAG: hypothetical protein ABI811_06570 [Acidobacteriota bacterium]
MTRFILCIVMGAAAFGQSTYKVPRTPWGDPDLQGIWPATDMINVPLNRPDQYGNRLYLNDDEFSQRATQAERTLAARQGTANPNTPVSINPPGYWLDNPKPSRQTSLIVEPENGKIPALTAEAQAKKTARAKAREGHGPNETYEDQSLYDRCISRGIMGSVLPVIYNNGNEIIQAPGYVSMQYEMIHEARIIPLTGSHPGPNIRSYMGDARGHWEGDTLVVETTNFLGDKNGLTGNGGGDPHSDALVLTERFSRVGPDQVNYEAYLKDAKTWTQPFRIAFPLKADPEYQLFEYACHEGNYAMFNMLSAARADEAAAAAAKK